MFTLPVRTCSVLNPGSTRSTRWKLASSSPAAIEQHERERHLARDEHAADEAGATAGRARAPFLADRLVQVHALHATIGIRLMAIADDEARARS